MVKYRHLTDTEITSLLENGCFADNWQDVMVSDNFDPRHLLRVRFSGTVRLGFNVRISNSAISDYIIGDNTSIFDVSVLFVDGESSFGIGFPVSCLNEAGGREVYLHKELSSQIAYIEAMYRYRSGMTSVFEELATGLVNASKSSYGIVGNNVTIRNAGTIRNVRIGDNAVLEDCLRLEEGTVADGSAKSGAYIGAGVICRNFVVMDGAEVSDNVNIDGVYVGQGVKLSKGFSAVSSLFFANSHCENGEAAAIFAGPYTVSHHKSTLLIGGMYSYMNAGSATNFSNHLYKLGPLHHGIFGRGVKFGSGSYMMLPVRAGAYSTISGHHKSHFDSSDFPFSYILNKGGDTYIVPGVNLYGAGLFRDLKKWKDRDRRKVSKRLDIINNEAVTPYTASAMLHGLESLKCALKHNSGEDLHFDGFSIEVSSAKKGVDRYEKALIYYIGLKLLLRLKGQKLDSDMALRAALVSESEIGGEKWTDLAGMIIPVVKLEDLLEELKDGKTGSFAELSCKLEEIERHYCEYEWKWVYEHFEVISGYSPAKMERKQVCDFIKRWKQVASWLYNAILSDASKEFAENMRYGFGIDGDKDADFLEVRGTLESTALFRQVQDLQDEAYLLADSVNLSF